MADKIWHISKERERNSQRPKVEKATYKKARQVSPDCCIAALCKPEKVRPSVAKKGGKGEGVWRRYYRKRKSRDYREKMLTDSAAGAKGRGPRDKSPIVSRDAAGEFKSLLLGLKPNTPLKDSTRR
jgi:hypothetical protein